VTAQIWKKERSERQVSDTFKQDSLAKGWKTLTEKQGSGGSLGMVKPNTLREYTLTENTGPPKLRGLGKG
jgi:hypothetical protein